MSERMIQDEKWMRIALEEAKIAMEEGEVPVGAVIVKDGREICRAHNQCMQIPDATAHAELLAISRACAALDGWRLEGCTLYVTLEPCPMCAGAAVNGRVDRIVYGAKDPRAGACESLITLTSYPLECKPQCEGGVLSRESQALLSRFFRAMRQK